jgi:hypothetical protein
VGGCADRQRSGKLKGESAQANALTPFSVARFALQFRLSPHSLLPVVLCWTMVGFPAPSSAPALRVLNKHGRSRSPPPRFAKEHVCGEPPHINPHTHVRSRKVRRARWGPRRLVRPRKRVGGGSPGISPRPGSRQCPRSVRFIRRHPRFRPRSRQTARLSVRFRQCPRRAGWL